MPVDARHRRCCPHAPHGTRRDAPDLGGALQLLWPGFAMAVFVVASWMPASLLRGLRVSFAAAVGRALGAAAAAHTGWLLAVGRQLGDQLGHLV